MADARAGRANAIHTGWRLGLLYCDQPEAALSQLIRRNPALSGRPIRSIADLQAAMAASDSVRHLVSYILSPEYLKAREVLGLARHDFDLSAARPAETDQAALAGKGVTEFELEIEEGAVDAADEGEPGDSQ